MTHVFYCCKISTKEDVFNLNYFTEVLTQTQIDVYNAIIGGKSFDDGRKIKGLNEYILPFAGKDGWDCEDETVQAFLKCEIGDDNTLPVPETGLIGWIISAAAYLSNR